MAKVGQQLQKTTHQLGHNRLQLSLPCEQHHQSCSRRRRSTTKACEPREVVFKWLSVNSRIWPLTVAHTSQGWPLSVWRPFGTQPPPRGGRKRRSRGNRRNNFHARMERVGSSLSLPESNSPNANLIADLYAPLRNAGGDFINKCPMVEHLLQIKCV